MKIDSRVLITGASGSLGSRVLLKLSELGYQVAGLGRSQCPSQLHSIGEWLRFDLSAEQAIVHDTDVLIHCAPLWLLPEFLKKLQHNRNLMRCIAMSSTSVIAKENALDDQDRKLARRLLNAENQLMHRLKEHINITILRPTLIYGYGEDKNITVIVNFIRKFGFFPIAGKANGLRQPVHVDDLVSAISSIISNPTSYGKTYTLAGGQTLSYREMLETIFLKLNRPPRIISIPLPVYRLLLAIRSKEYSPGSANRMNQNLNYDIEAAITDFNYQPQVFLKNPDKDLI